MDLNTIEEIKAAIEALTPQQRDELYDSFDERYLEAGDAQLKAALTRAALMIRLSMLLPTTKRGERNRLRKL